MRDSNLILRNGSGGNVIATVTGAWIDLGKGGEAPSSILNFDMVVPAIAAGADTLTPKLDFSDDASTVKESLSFPAVTGAGSAPTVRSLMAPSVRRRYVRVVLTVTGASPNFGAVDVRAATGASHRDFNLANA